jgi:NAD+ diphosphatase
MKFNYCPEDGTKTSFIKLGDDILSHCPMCNRNYQDFFYTCVIIVARNSSGKIACIKQSYGRDRYVLVAGFVKPNETLTDACKREILEEIGLASLNIKYLGSMPMEKTENLMVGFLVDVDGFINLSSEVKEIVFVSKEEALDLLKDANIASNFVRMI